MYVVRLSDVRNLVPLSGVVIISEADALARATTNYLPFLFCSQDANTTNHASISKLYFGQNRCLVNPLALPAALCSSCERDSRAAGKRQYYRAEAANGCFGQEIEESMQYIARRDSILVCCASPQSQPTPHGPSALTSIPQGP